MLEPFASSLRPKCASAGGGAASIAASATRVSASNPATDGGPAAQSRSVRAKRRALTWWAADEVIRGVNPWRRVIGVAGLVFVVLRLVGR